MVPRARQFKFSDRDMLGECADERRDEIDRIACRCRHAARRCLDDHVTGETDIEDEPRRQRREERPDGCGENIEAEPVAVWPELGHRAAVRRPAGHARAALPVRSDATPSRRILVGQQRLLGVSPSLDEVAEQGAQQRGWV